MKCWGTSIPPRVHGYVAVALPPTALIHAVCRFVKADSNLGGLPMKKNRSQRDTEPAQPLLSGVNFARLLLQSGGPVCICAVSVQKGAVHFCADMPWRCPRTVPPTCNTGVHAPSNRGAASAPVEEITPLQEVTD